MLFSSFLFLNKLGPSEGTGYGIKLLIFGAMRGELRRVLAGVYIMIAVSALLKICSPHTLVYPLSLRPFPSS